MGRKPKKVDYSSVSDILVPYRRVSTREQADSGAGISAQDTHITFALGMRGATALTWDCLDEGKSGKNLNRPGLEMALKLVRAGEAGGIVVSKLDRLSRSLLDFATLMAAAKKEGWNLIALDLGVDLSTPEGAMMANVLATFAEYERQLIGKRTKDALAEKRADGVRLGRPREIGDDLLAEIVRAYVSTDNYSAVAKMLNDNQVPQVRGGKQWFPATVRNLLMSQDGAKLLDSAA